MLGNKYRKTVFNRIEDDLHECISEFDQIELDDAVATEELIRIYGEESRKNSFKRLGLINEKKGVSYGADELSEGTLYFLALLCIINQPNPPKLLLLEEPEKGIHPRRIREVMDFIFRLAEEKDVQIILTTHNENVLNEFTSIPEAVFVFEKDEEGATHVKNLLTDIIEPSRKRSQETGTKEIDFTSNLGENWMYGLLGGVPEEAL
jgi:predicted ATPase